MSSNINKDYRTEASNILSAALNAFLNNNKVEQGKQRDIVQSLNTIVTRTDKDRKKLEEHSSLSLQLSKAKAELEKLKIQLDAAKVERTNMVQEIERLKQQAKIAELKIQKDAEEITNLKSVVSEQIVENSDLKKETISVEKKNKETADKNKKLQQEIENLKSQSNVLKVQQLKERIRELSTLNTQLQKCSNYKPATNRYFVI